jgi:hypothetical protein
MSRDVIERKEFQYAPAGAGVIQLFSIPAGWAVVGLYARVDQARVGGTSVTVGETGGDIDGYFTEAQLDTDGAIGLRAAAPGAFMAGLSTGGKLYLAKDTIDAALIGTMDPLPIIKFICFTRRVIGV